MLGGEDFGIGRYAATQAAAVGEALFDAGL